MGIDVVRSGDGAGWIGEVWLYQTGEAVHYTPVYPTRDQARAEALVWATAQGRK